MSVHDNPVDRACAALYAAGAGELAEELSRYVETIAISAAESERRHFGCVCGDVTAALIADRSGEIAQTIRADYGPAFNSTTGGTT